MSFHYPILIATAVLASCTPDVVSKIPETEKTQQDSLRVLYWNIQNGMWADQQNNYSNFVNWVASQRADICIWCEAETIYYDGTKTAKPATERYLPSCWGELAELYGHQYWGIGKDRNNYPQVVTSKNPMETLKQIEDDQGVVKHGAGLFRVQFKGRMLYVIVAHMTPDGESNNYGAYESSYIIAQTRNDKTYSGNDLWIMAGDFNSQSRLDDWYYKWGIDSPYYLCQNVILDNTDFVDAVPQKHPGKFFVTAQGSQTRKDYIYLSKALYRDCVDAFVVNEGWAGSVRKSTEVPSFYEPSDHMPIIVDIVFEK